MIPRVVTGIASGRARPGAMLKGIGRRPAYGAMAGITLHARARVKVSVTWLRRGTNATDMTIQTSSCSIITVDPGGAQETGGGMTGRAIQRGWNMGGVGLGVHTCSAITMATGAGAIIHNAGMIIGRANKACGVVANAAILGGVHMVHGFAPGKYPVMTGTAIIDDTFMRKARR